MEAADTAEPQALPFTDPATGIATDGEWPINLNFRAEAMARAGVTTDPAEMVSDQVIAETKDRLDSEATEAAKADAGQPSMTWTRDRLIEEATRRGAAFETDANKAAILDAINAAPAA